MSEKGASCEPDEFHPGLVGIAEKIALGALYLTAPGEGRRRVLFTDNDLGEAMLLTRDSLPEEGNPLKEIRFDKEGRSYEVGIAVGAIARIGTEVSGEGGIFFTAELNGTAPELTELEQQAAAQVGEELLNSNSYRLVA